jgi:hypothetical protein
MTFELNGSDALERQLVTETELAAIFNASEESVYLYICFPLIPSPPSPLPLTSLSLPSLPLPSPPRAHRVSRSTDGRTSIRYLSDTVEIKREVVEEEKEAYVPRTASHSIA